MKKTQILIVEDEVIILLDIKSALIKLGYEVVATATNYNDAIRHVESKKPDLIIMDINLNDTKDGIDIATKVLETNKIPIIYLTAYSDEKILERAVKTNPAGYVIKPFKRDDLKVAIQLALFKLKKKTTNVVADEKIKYIGGGYYYNFESDSLYYEDLVIKLSVKELKLLKLLLSANGDIITYEQIEYELWGEKLMSGSTLRTLIYRLRAKLNNKLIENVYSQGCKFISHP